MHTLWGVCICTLVFMASLAVPLLSEAAASAAGSAAATLGSAAEPYVVSALGVLASKYGGKALYRWAVGKASEDVTSEIHSILKDPYDYLPEEERDLYRDKVPDINQVKRYARLKYAPHKVVKSTPMLPKRKTNARVHYSSKLPRSRYGSAVAHFRDFMRDISTSRYWQSQSLSERYRLHNLLFEQFMGKYHSRYLSNVHTAPYSRRFTRRRKKRVRFKR